MLLTGESSWWRGRSNEKHRSHRNGQAAHSSWKLLAGCVGWRGGGCSCSRRRGTRGTAGDRVDGVACLRRALVAGGWDGGRSERGRGAARRASWSRCDRNRNRDDGGAGRAVGYRLGDWAGHTAAWDNDGSGG